MTDGLRFLDFSTEKRKFPAQRVLIYSLSSKEGETGIIYIKTEWLKENVFIRKQFPFFSFSKCCLLRGPETVFEWVLDKIKVVYHLLKKSGHFIWDINGKTIVVLPNRKFPK